MAGAREPALAAASARGEGAVIEGLRLEPALASRALRAHLAAKGRAGGSGRSGKREGSEKADVILDETMRRGGGAAGSHVHEVLRAQGEEIAARVS